MDNTLLEDKCSIKQELEDNDYLDEKICISETALYISDVEAKDPLNDSKFKLYEVSTLDDVNEEIPSLKIENKIRDVIKMENENSAAVDTENTLNNGLLFCDECHAYYEDYCSTCGMLVQILNSNTTNNMHNSICGDIPRNILEIRQSFEQFGIFALKCIPKGVRFGPFTGLNSSERSWKLRGGNFIVGEDKANILNWMRYVNPGKDIFEQNLRVFQWEDNLYYCNTREIQTGEELLVYFSEECDSNLNKDVEMDFVPITESDVRNVFACTFCCLGFSSKLYLAKHKTVCFSGGDGNFPIKELAQCSFCKIYMDEKEYVQYHMACCYERNFRKGTPLLLDNLKVENGRRKTQRLQMHKCTHCNYKATYKVEMNNHINKHYEMKMYRCRICCKRFKTRGFLKRHMETVHISAEERENQENSMNDYEKGRMNASHSKEKQFKCPRCDFRTKFKYYLKNHIKSKHLKQFDYKCETCKFRTKAKRNLARHIETKHLKEFKHECNMCQHKTNNKASLKIHIKRKHLKIYDYKCELCKFKTNWRLPLEIHIKSKHLKTFDYACVKCEYKTNSKYYLDRHVKTRHLKEFDYRCEICGYETNDRHYLEYHNKTLHLKDFNYKCEICAYKANKKSRLDSHIRTQHLKEYNYNCDICKFETNSNSHLRVHIKTKHLKEFRYKCEECEYETERRISLEVHIKTKHLKEFSYKCEICEFKTNWRKDLDKHVKTRHLQEFNFKCDMCDYKAKWKASLESHINNKHLREFKYKCEICDYKTNNKAHLKAHKKDQH